MSSFFVAGTDTDVGKTSACRAIIQALQAKGVRYELWVISRLLVAVKQVSIL